MLAQGLLLALLPLVYAQAYGGSGGSSSSSSSSSPSSTVAAAAESASPSSGVHDVDVGEDGVFAYTPNTLKASVGDTVNFHFYPLNHSVVQSSFNSPCTPLQGGIFSGFHPSSNDEAVSHYPPSSRLLPLDQCAYANRKAQMFSVTINDTNPIWLYCAQTVKSHCQSGMVMVINPPASGNTLAAYKSAAANTHTSTSPATIQGGVVLPNKDSDNSTASTSGSPSSSSTSVAASSSPTGDAPMGRKVEWAFMGVVLLATGWAWTLM